jgi:hypothetical protein
MRQRAYNILVRGLEIAVQLLGRQHGGLIHQAAARPSGVVKVKTKRVGGNSHIEIMTREARVDQAGLEVDDAALNGGGGGLRTIVRSQLAQNVLHVIFYCVLGDPQLERDLLVAMAFDDQL